MCVARSRKKITGIFVLKKKTSLDKWRKISLQSIYNKDKHTSFDTSLTFMILIDTNFIKPLLVNRTESLHSNTF